jgi:hypothetical protein
VATTFIAYVAMAGITLLLIGPAYGWQQYAAYFFVTHPINPSLWQGNTSLLVPHIVRLLLLVPLFLIAARHLITRVRFAIGEIMLMLVSSCRHRPRQAYASPSQSPRLALDWLFLLYLILATRAGQATLPNLPLATVIFPYLLATSHSRTVRVSLACAFIPYALLDIWRVGQFALQPATIAFDALGAIDHPILWPAALAAISVFGLTLSIRLWRYPRAQLIAPVPVPTFEEVLGVS